MICYRLLSGDEDCFRLAMCSGLTKEEKRTQYKLACIAQRYRLGKEEVLDILEKSFVLNSQELQVFLHDKYCPLSEMFIETLRNKSQSTKLATMDEDKAWYIKLLGMDW